MARPDKRGKNVTIIGAMALRGIIGAMTFRGNRHPAFLTFVKEVLVPSLWRGATVVMDNFTHLVTGVKEAIESVGAKLVYLSPIPDFLQLKTVGPLKEFYVLGISNL